MPGLFDRSANLRRLAEADYDVLIIGGGITGAGVALDAASRGLRTALVERDDFASGTSSKSSKLVHGGLRYLQQGEIKLVYEALHERQRLRRNAPHLVKVLPFLIPIFAGKDGVVPKKLARAMGSAMWTYDLTGGVRIGKVHKRIDIASVRAHMPTLRGDRLAPSYLYYDAQADDARLTLAIARTAVIEHGATAVNGCSAVAVRKDDRGRAVGATVEADGKRFDVSARVLVNAAGVWSDDVRAMDEGADPESIRPAKGVHVVIPWSRVRNDIAVVIPVPKDRRSVFVVPWGDLTYVGTTDTDYDGPTEDPQCTTEDIDYLLGALNFSMSSEVSRDDIVGTWAGLRPLVRDASSDRTADLSRQHKVQRSASGVITITGGKLTTYRKMASDTVGEVIDTIGRDHLPGVNHRTRTKRLPIRGAEGYQALVDEASTAAATLDRRTVVHLADRYGGEARAIIAMADRNPSLAEPLVPSLPYIRAEAVFSARYEMARSLDDILTRRTRARLLARDETAQVAAQVADLVSAELGWDSDETARQVAGYEALVLEERESAQLPDTHLVSIRETSAVPTAAP